MPSKYKLQTAIGAIKLGKAKKNIQHWLITWPLVERAPHFKSLKRWSLLHIGNLKFETAFKGIDYCQWSLRSKHQRISRSIESTRKVQERYRKSTGKVQEKWACVSTAKCDGNRAATPVVANEVEMKHSDSCAFGKLIQRCTYVVVFPASTWAIIPMFLIATLALLSPLEA